MIFQFTPSIGSAVVLVILLLSIWSGFAVNEAQAPAPLAEETPPEASATNVVENPSPVRTNWFVYYHEQSEDHAITRFIPWYTYELWPQHGKESFFLWPLLTEYATEKTAAESPVPFAAPYQWYTLPLLTLGGSQLSQEGESTTFISFLLMTFFQERYLTNGCEANSWYSLPVLSFYNRERLLVSEGQIEIENTTLGNPLFFFQDITLRQGSQRFPVSTWRISPVAYLFGSQSSNLVYQARWGADRSFSLFSFEGFSLFSLSTAGQQYPGAAYQRFAYYETDTAKGLQALWTPPSQPPMTRLGFLEPLFLIETRSSEATTWQILPLVYYTSQAQEYQLTLLPLGLEIGTQGIRFAPKAKVWPLFYHDEARRQWSILWPLFQYTDDPARQRWTIPLVVDYDLQTDAQGQTTLDFTVAERMLFSYVHKKDKTRFEVLPWGLAFSYYQTPEYWHYRLFSFGYGETATTQYLQFLFLNIPIGQIQH